MTSKNFKMTSKLLQNDYDPIVHTAHRRLYILHVRNAQGIMNNSDILNKLVYFMTVRILRAASVPK